jgi:glutamate dehydrogenase/leucine dehydrogenase
MSATRSTRVAPIRPIAREEEDLNPFRIAMRQFDTAAEKLHLDAGMREILRRPRRALSLSLPVKMDNGSIRVFEGFRVQHNNARGPCRRHPLSPEREL